MRLAYGVLITAFNTATAALTLPVNGPVLDTGNVEDIPTFPLTAISPAGRRDCKRNLPISMFPSESDCFTAITKLPSVLKRETSTRTQDHRVRTHSGYQEKYNMDNVSSRSGYTRPDREGFMAHGQRSGIRWQIWNSTVLNPRFSIESPLYTLSSVVRVIGLRPDRPWSLSYESPEPQNHSTKV